jgi:hypothetical protein
MRHNGHRVDSQFPEIQVYFSDGLGCIGVYGNAILLA